MLMINSITSSKIQTHSSNDIQEITTNGSDVGSARTSFDFKPVNLSQHDAKTFVVAVDEMETDQSIFSAADALALDSKEHQVKIFYYGELHNHFYNYIRDRYSHLPQQDPQRYVYDVQVITKEDKAKDPLSIRDRIRPAILNYVKEKKPKFVVVGIAGGLSAALLGSETDIAFRQCLGSTPIICKKEYIFKKIKAKDTSDNHCYKSSVFAFRVDFSDDAMHAFTLMIDHIRNGDTIHLIWIKPQQKLSVFGNADSGVGDETNIVFKPFKSIIERMKLIVEIKSHIFFKPNVGECLLSVANDKKYDVNFLIVYCDLMSAYAKGEELIGSVTDWCVRYCKCPVIVPKL